MNIKEVLFSLADKKGVSGQENNVAETALNYLKQ